jgi:hypothetical protein
LKRNEIAVKLKGGMRYIYPLVAVVILMVSQVHASQSIIVDSEGYACMGDDKSRKETEQNAMLDARRKGGEAALTHIKSETHVKDAMLEKDLMSAYANAQVKLLQELLKEWFKDPGSGDCYRVKLKLEVRPDEKSMTGLGKNQGASLADDPAAPLSVRVWTDRREYRQGQKVKIYLKGNKPFFGRVVYRDVAGNLVQLLPNPYRKDNYFNGGVVYELPGGEDRFDLEVTPPFGSEDITVYASTAKLGELEIAPVDGVYEVRTQAKDVAVHTRGIRIAAKGAGGGDGAAEFSEAQLTVTTGHCCRK